MISSWKEYWPRKTIPIPGSSLSRWVPCEELEPEMTGKFRRIHDRAMRRARRLNEAVVYVESRRYVRVATRKHHARRKRRKSGDCGDRESVAM